MNDLIHTRLPDSLLSENAVAGLTNALAAINFEPPCFSDEQVMDLLGLQHSEVQEDPFLDGTPCAMDYEDHLVTQTQEGPVVAAWVPSYRRWLILTLEASAKFLEFPAPDNVSRQARAKAICVFDDIKSAHKDKVGAVRALRSLPGADKTRRELIDEAAREFGLRGLKYFAVGLGLKQYLDRREELEREAEEMMESYPG